MGAQHEPRGHQPAKRKRDQNPVVSAGSRTTRPRSVAAPQFHGHGGHFEGDPWLPGLDAEVVSWPPTMTTGLLDSSPESKSGLPSIAPAHNTGFHAGQTYRQPRGQHTAKPDQHYAQPAQHHRSSPAAHSPGNGASVMQVVRPQLRAHQHATPSPARTPGLFYTPDIQYSHRVTPASQVGDARGAHGAHSQFQFQTQTPSTDAVTDFAYWSTQQARHALGDEHMNDNDDFAFSSEIHTAGLVHDTQPLTSQQFSVGQATSGVAASLLPQNQQTLYALYGYQQQPSSSNSFSEAVHSDTGRTQTDEQYIHNQDFASESHHRHQQHQAQQTPYFSSTMGGGDYHPGQPVASHRRGSQALRQIQNVDLTGLGYTTADETVVNEPSTSSYDNAPLGQGHDDMLQQNVAPLVPYKQELQSGHVSASPRAANQGTASQGRVMEHDGQGDEEDDDDDDDEGRIVDCIRQYESNSDFDSDSDSESGSDLRPGKKPRQVAKRRGALDPVKRQETAETRKRKACLRCRAQKGRCDANPDDPWGPCLPCKKFSRTSKKTIHFLPCFRGKVTDAVLFRQGGLNLTKRWTGTEMKDVADRPTPHDIRTIHISLGACDKPMVVDVVRYTQKEGDVTARFWTVQEFGDDVRRKKELEPYCLADIHRTAKYFEQYIIENAIPSMMKQRLPPVRLFGRSESQLGVIEQTYKLAMEHYEVLEEKSGEGVNPEKRLMGNLFILWFAMRHTTGMSYICGEEKLGMKPEVKDATYPLFGKVSLPRMILAQFDSINSTRLLSVYGKRVLRDLELLTSHLQPHFWWTIYLSTFILLREASWISEDRYRHARNNYGKKLRYSIPAFVEELQEGCNNVLYHWHYYNAKPWPDPLCPHDRYLTFLSELTSEQYDHVARTMTHPQVLAHLSVWKQYREENGITSKPKNVKAEDGETEYLGVQRKFDWDHPFYWIAQLFEDHSKWTPYPTYQREYPA